MVRISLSKLALNVISLTRSRMSSARVGTLLRSIGLICTSSRSSTGLLAISGIKDGLPA